MANDAPEPVDRDADFDPDSYDWDGPDGDAPDPTLAFDDPARDRARDLTDAWSGPQPVGAWRERDPDAVKHVIVRFGCGAIAAIFVLTGLSASTRLLIDAGPSLAMLVVAALGTWCYLTAVNLPPTYVWRGEKPKRTHRIRDPHPSRPSRRSGYQRQRREPKPAPRESLRRISG
jgi:hypothetical protein